MSKIRIGYRGKHAPHQMAQQVGKEIEAQGHEVNYIAIGEEGDIAIEAPSIQQEGKGLYSDSLEKALADQHIDIAIHYMPLLPVRSPEELSITALTQRNRPSDWLIQSKDKAAKKLFRLAEGARVAAATARRQAQILHYRPDLQVVAGFEDADMAFEQLKKDQADAVILSSDALEYSDLNLTEYDVVRFNAREFVPAPAQGVIALQTRRDDLELRRSLKPLHHQEVARCTNVERSIIRLFDNQLHLPLGVYCERDPIGHYHVWAAFAGKPGAPLKQLQYSQSTTDGLAEKIHELLLEG